MKTPQQVSSELVPIQRELSVIAERLRIKQTDGFVFVAIEEPPIFPKRSFVSWLKVISAAVGWGVAALAVYVGIGFVVAECIAWIMGAIR